MQNSFVRKIISGPGKGENLLTATFSNHGDTAVFLIGVFYVLHLLWQRIKRKKRKEKALRNLCIE